MTGGTSEVVKRTAAGVLHQITFDRALRRGEQYSFSFRERVPEEENAEPPAEDFAGQTFESPTLSYRSEVAYLGDRPGVVWAYDKLSRVERPGEATAENRVHMGDSGLVAAKFTVPVRRSVLRGGVAVVMTIWLPPSPGRHWGQIQRGGCRDWQAVTC